MVIPIFGRCVDGGGFVLKQVADLALHHGLVSSIIH